VKNAIASLILAILPTTRCFAIKRYILTLLGISVGPGTKVCGRVVFLGAGKVTIGADCWIGPGARFYTSTNGNVILGDRCDIAPEVCFETGSHHIGDAMRRAGEDRGDDIVVSSGTWIGTRAILLGGCRIQGPSVIGAQSLLLPKIYPADAVIVGSPGRVVKTL
jgi:maltose O-acetyltransferase